MRGVRVSGYPSLVAFAEQIGTPFTVAVDGGPVDFTLVEVREGIESQHYAPFSLEFTAPGDVALPQATYSLAHGTLGTLDIFLVPVAREGGLIRYEAVFNVAKESEG
jgi:hypothetical protein